MQTKLSDRFWAKARVGEQDACWEWSAFRCKDGYGRIQVGNRSVNAHRVAYELTRGAIPPGMQIDHLCRNRGCVNPSHLEVVTQQENMRRGISGQRQRAVTHCPAGHEYNEENTFCSGTAKRRCRQCHRDRAAAYQASRKAENATKTHCVRGHEYTPDNTVVGEFRRYCLACSRAKRSKRPTAVESAVS